jgi:hypothetical protein
MGKNPIPKIPTSVIASGLENEIGILTPSSKLGRLNYTLFKKLFHELLAKPQVDTRGYSHSTPLGLRNLNKPFSGPYKPIEVFKPWKLEIGNWKLGIGNWELGIGNWECRLKDV